MSASSKQGRSSWTSEAQWSSSIAAAARRRWRAGRRRRRRRRRRDTGAAGSGGRRGTPRNAGRRRAAAATPALCGAVDGALQRQLDAVRGRHARLHVVKCRLVFTLCQVIIDTSARRNQRPKEESRDGGSSRRDRRSGHGRTRRRASRSPRAGFRTTVIEATDRPGGKMRDGRRSGAAPIDVGPTVLTMRWAFERLFEEAGAVAFGLGRRSSGPSGSRATPGRTARGSTSIPTSTAAPRRSRASPGAREARGLPALLQARARRSTRRCATASSPARRPGPIELSARIGLGTSGGSPASRPFTPMWRALEDHFRDPRLRQLFGRYATYCGSSPFLAPATLMLVAHVEREGVWLVEGGMARLADALARARRGARRRVPLRVAGSSGSWRPAAGPPASRPSDGERIAADAVVWNGDVAALADGSLGPGGPARGRRATSAGTVAVGDDLGDVGARSAAFRSSATTSSSRATARPSSTTCSPAPACLRARPSTFAPRIATIPTAQRAGRPRARLLPRQRAGATGEPCP